MEYKLIYINIKTEGERGKNYRIVTRSSLASGNILMRTENNFLTF